MTSACAGPFLISRASSTACWYLTILRVMSSSTARIFIPKYTLNWPLISLLSYSQMAVTLCLPSLLTESTTYSFPSKNSCRSTPSFTTPSPLMAPLILSKPRFTSSKDPHRKTSSDPADWLGFTMTLNGSGFQPFKKADASSHVDAIFCLTALTPALRIVSPITYLFLRAVDRYKGLVLVLNLSASLSASSTPVSAPGRMARMGYPRALSLAAVWSKDARSSGLRSSCWTVSPLRSVPDWTRAATGESVSEKSIMSL
mmetsp:Transcript_16313/g.33238  ORF Transcript_16313/g.33238 Transcript_16313/m.33238 type:complete len:257 (-) Transcript_16313:753-1523(-)